MKVDLKEFSIALKRVLKVVPSKHVNSILIHVLLEARDGVLTVTGTDLKRTLSARLVCTGDFSAALPAHLLGKLITGTGGEIELTSGPDGRVLLQMAGRLVRLNALPVEDFPRGLSPEDFLEVGNAETWDLRDTLSWVLLSVHPGGPLRSSIQGVRFTGNRLVATDGHRMHVAYSPVPVTEPITLPAAAVKDLIGVLESTGTTRILLGDVGTPASGYARVEVHNAAALWTLTSNVIGEDYPPWEVVTPPRGREKSNLLRAEAADLRRRLKNVVNVCQNHVEVNLTFGDGLIRLEPLIFEDGDPPEFEIPLSVLECGGRRNIRFNSRYLLDSIPLKCGGDLEIEVVGERDPIRVDLADGKLAVVMPARL